MGLGCAFSPRLEVCTVLAWTLLWRSSARRSWFRGRVLWSGFCILLCTSCVCFLLSMIRWVRHTPGIFMRVKRAQRTLFACWVNEFHMNHTGIKNSITGRYLRMIKRSLVTTMLSSDAVPVRLLVTMLVLNHRTAKDQLQVISRPVNHFHVKNFSSDLYASNSFESEKDLCNAKLTEALGHLRCFTLQVLSWVVVIGIAFYGFRQGGKCAQTLCTKNRAACWWSCSD